MDLDDYSISNDIVLVYVRISCLIFEIIIWIFHSILFLFFLVYEHLLSSLVLLIIMLANLHLYLTGKDSDTDIKTASDPSYQIFYQEKPNLTQPT